MVVVEWVTPDEVWVEVWLAGFFFGFFFGFLMTGEGTVEVGVLAVTGVTTGRCEFEVEDEPQPATTPADRRASAAPACQILDIST